jgi:Chaperone of endosialidase
MNISWSLVVGIAGLVLVLPMGPSWGDGPPQLERPIRVDNNQSNTAGGFFGLEVNNTGSENTAFGQGTLRSNNDGFSNTGVGSGALLSNTDGDDNTAVGTSALFSNKTGNDNTAVGSNALNNVDGARNTAVGSSALADSFDGVNNTAIGFEALSELFFGFNNTAIGRGAGSMLTNGNFNIYLGHTGVPTESNTMRIGQTNLQTRTFIAGIRDVNVGANTMPVLINQNGRLGTQGSSARYKRDIETMGTRSQGLLQLRPVTFRYKQDERGKLEYGLIAEEVAEVYPELVTRNDNGEVESVRYHVLIPMLLNELQYQQRQLGAQEEQLSVLKTDNEQLRALVAQQQERDAALAARLERLEAEVAPATLARR